MRAVSVTPGQKRSAVLREVPAPLYGPQEVLVRVIDVGVDATDAEIDEGLYGEAPPGEDVLIIGHESLGRVERVGTAVRELRHGDLVVATVRRPGECLNCRIGESDMCRDGDYTERGIRGAHGFMADYYVDRPEFLVRLPPAFRAVGVLLEPLSIAEKAVVQSFAVQRRLRWEPKRALVLGAGPIGLLAALVLRTLRGLEVTVVGREVLEASAPKHEIVRRIGARYVSTLAVPVLELPRRFGAVDLIIEATGHPQVALDAAQILGRNGVLCLLGIPGRDETALLPAARLIRGLVLGNQVVLGSVNASRRYFDLGIQHLGEFERRWPGLLPRLITRRLPLEDFREALESRHENIKVVLEGGSREEVGEQPS